MLTKQESTVLIAVHRRGRHPPRLRRIAVPDRIRDPEVGRRFGPCRHRFADVSNGDGVLAERVENHPIERRSQPDDVEARAFDERPRGRRLERYPLARRTGVHPPFRVSAIFNRAAVDDVGVLEQEFDDVAPPIQGATHEDDSRMRRRGFDEGRQPLLILFRGPALALRDQQLLGLEYDDHSSRHHHRMRVGGIDQPRGRDVCPVEAIDVECPQALVDQLEKLRGDVPLLDFIRTNQCVKRRRLARGDVLAQSGGGNDRQTRRPPEWQLRRSVPDRWPGDRPPALPARAGPRPRAVCRRDSDRNPR